MKLSQNRSIITFPVVHKLQKSATNCCSGQKCKKTQKDYMNSERCLQVSAEHGRFRANSGSANAQNSGYGRPVGQRLSCSVPCNALSTATVRLKPVG